MISTARSRSVRKSLIEIRIPIVPISAEAARRIVSAGGSAKFRQQSHRQKCNALVVHRLVITALRGDELADVEHIVQRSARALPQRRGSSLRGGMPFNCGKRKRR